MRIPGLILIPAILAGCAQQNHRSTKAPSPFEAKSQPLSEAEILVVARQAHSAMSIHPASYNVHGIEAERQGTNWTVHVWLLNPGSHKPNIGDWSSEGEVFQMSGDGKVISYDPNVFP